MVGGDATFWFEVGITCLFAGLAISDFARGLIVLGALSLILTGLAALVLVHFARKRRIL